MRGARNCGAALIVAFVLAGCDRQTTDPVQPTDVNCVDVPDGAYFRVVDGRFVSVDAPKIVSEMPPETQRRIEASLARTGFTWISLEWDGEVAIVRGTAPDENTRSDGFEFAQSSFEADPIASERLLRVLDETVVRDSVEKISDRLSDALAAQGHGWMRIEIKDNVAILDGAAPNLDAKSRGERIARALIANDVDAVEIVEVTVDAVTVSGRTPPAGLALLDLNVRPNLIACQNAFFNAMSGREIEFTPGEAVLTNSSLSLLDTVTAIAILCRAFEIEIGQHSDGESSDTDAIDLTQRRASAVRDYLSAYGASRDAIFARGYGAAQPLDIADTEEARARNRRTEFTVRMPRD